MGLLAISISVARSGIVASGHDTHEIGVICAFELGMCAGEPRDSVLKDFALICRNEAINRILPVAIVFDPIERGSKLL